MFAKNLMLYGAPKLPFIYDFTLADALPAGVSLTRASLGQVFGSTLALEEKAVDAPRFRYDLTSGLSRGLLIEAARTNGIRNSTFAGAVAGTPGTVPNLQSWSSSGDGLTRQIVGTGVEDGIDYIDVRFYGTPSATGSRTISFESSANIPAVAGQTWTGSLYYRLIGGSTANLTFVAFMTGRTSGGSFVMGGSFVPAPTSAVLKTTRGSCTATLVGGTIAGIDLDFRLAYTSGLAVDCTIRFGLPQLERGEAASTPVKTTAAAATRAVEIVTITHPVLAYPTWVARGRTAAALHADGEGYLMSWDGTANNMIALRRNSSGGLRLTIVVGGVSEADVNLGAVSNDTDFKVAVRLEANNVAASLNGAAVVTDTSVALPVVSEAQIGRYHSSASQANSTIRSVEFRPDAASNAQLQALAA
ncbi:MAG: hypothetical protein K9G48_08620 [Reyranella sp.]|nr:hypothetical protein [Reyranella sp.]